jgi:hypothetical protein
VPRSSRNWSRALCGSPAFITWATPWSLRSANSGKKSGAHAVLRNAAAACDAIRAGAARFGFVAASNVRPRSRGHVVGSRWCVIIRCAAVTVVGGWWWPSPSFGELALIYPTKPSTTHPGVNESSSGLYDD